MRITFLFFCFVLAFEFQASKAQNLQMVKITEVAKLFEMQDDTLRIFNFWATWCAPCVKELPYFEEARKQLGDQKVKIILVAIEDEFEKVATFVKKKNLESTLFYLNEKDANYWIPFVNADWEGEIPVTLAIRKGKKAFHSGDFTKEQLMAFIQNQL